MTNLTEPCNGKCFTEYRTLRNRTKYGGLRATYQCESGDCVLMRDMCNGYAACQDESDLKECDDDLQCISTNGGYEITSYQGHYTCSYINAENDGEYDNIHRKDEDYLFEKVTRVNFDDFEQCKNSGTNNNQVGLSCGDKCTPADQWCLDRSKFSVTTHSCPKNVSLPSDDKYLCKNKTFWSEMDKNTTAFWEKNTTLCNNEPCDMCKDVTCDMCDIFVGEQLFANGSRCTGNLQHCYYPWYHWNWQTEYQRTKYPPTCSDNSDKIFHVDTTCNTTHYVNIYCDYICKPGKELQFCNKTICNVSTVSQWLEDNKNDRYLMDPHDCQSSCSSPGPDCEACTNTDYFRCRDGATCLHPDLLCDGHQHCKDGSDEDFDYCYFQTKAYLKKKVVEEFATLKCKSIMYPQIYTLATVCDGIEECYDPKDHDEPTSCTSSNTAMIGISCIVIITIVFYFLQQWILKKWVLDSLVTTPDNDKEEITMKTTDEDKEFENVESYLKLHEDDDEESFKFKINCYLAKLKYSTDCPETVEESIKQITEYERKYHKGDTAQMVCWFHNNLYPDLYKMVMDIEDPGFFRRKMPDIKKKVERLFDNKNFVALYNIWRLIMHQVDILKDSLLVATLLKLIGGPSTLYYFPKKFTSTVVLSMALTIVIPMLISSLGLLIEDPGVIYTPLAEILPIGTGKWRHYVRFQIIILSFFNSALLVNAYNENVAKRSKETGESLLDRLKEGRRIKTQYVKYLRSELGLEIFYQVPIQIVLLCFAYTDTKTTGGLDIFFQESSWYGIPGQVILGLSSGWSVISSVLSHRKSIKDEKVYLSTKSQVCVCLWGLAGTLKRLISIVGVFLPGLGKGTFNSPLSLMH